MQTMFAKHPNIAIIAIDQSIHDSTVSQEVVVSKRDSGQQKRWNNSAGAVMPTMTEVQHY